MLSSKTKHIQKQYKNKRKTADRDSWGHPETVDKLCIKGHSVDDLCRSPETSGNKIKKKNIYIRKAGLQLINTDNGDHGEHEEKQQVD